MDDCGGNSLHADLLEMIEDTIEDMREWDDNQSEAEYDADEDEEDDEPEDEPNVMEIEVDLGPNAMEEELPDGTIIVREKTAADLEGDEAWLSGKMDDVQDMFELRMNCIHHRWSQKATLPWGCSDRDIPPEQVVQNDTYFQGKAWVALIIDDPTEPLADVLEDEVGVHWVACEGAVPTLNRETGNYELKVRKFDG